MRAPKPEWLRRLRDATGSQESDIRFNEAVSRWEFLVPAAAGGLESQFFGWFVEPADPVTGLYEFRDLDEQAMTEILDSLTTTRLDNRFDGAGNTRKEMLRRYRGNKEAGRKHYRERGELLADMVQDRARRLRGDPLIVVPSVVGGRGQTATAASTSTGTS